jgi:hypothetical protein
MAAEIIQIDAQSFLSQTYENQDTNLISSFDVKTSLSSSSYLEFFIYDNNKNILDSDYNFTQYTIQNDGQSPGNDGDISEIIIDPEQILINLGYDQGEYTTYFNIFNKQIGTNLQNLYITEISSDRTEIRLDSTSLTEIDLIEQSNNLIQQRVSSSYFLDFYLNFGDNQLAIANNIELDIQDPTNPTILIKLYEPLSDQYDLNSLLWVVTVVEEPIAYQVIFEDVPIVIIDTVPINGPNFNLELKDKINNSTLNQSYQDLTATTLTSSFNQLNSLLEEKEIDINIDYTNFSEFTHFSSVKTRLENFYYKVSLIEQYSSSIATLNNTNSSSVAIGNTQTIYETQINNIITNFDGYDYYLYYSSGSYAWPKTTSQPPYLLAKTGSNAVLTWFGSAIEGHPYYGGITLSASRFDESNKDYLFYVIPEYLREDPNNDQYKMFIDMVGQFYDNIWIYYKDVTQKYNADNRLENGISKDIVADAIRDFGIKLYQNNFSNEDLYTAFLGLTPNGALFPFPNITSSLPTPSGFEYIDTLISASNDYMPLDDVNKSLYKRIYHNLPYLLKSKGTLPGLRALITSYGIPDTVLRIKEYGGKDKVNSNDWDYWQDTFNYAFFTTGSNSIVSNWKLNPNWNSPDSVPSTLSFRFKTEGLPTSSIPYSQSLWYTNTFSSIVLQYTGSGYNTNLTTSLNPSGLPYSGSIIDPYYQYANLVFYPDPTTYPGSSASIYLPFFDGGWWSVMVTRNGNDFNLHAGNKIYEGGDNGTLLGFYATSSITEDSTFWTLGSNTTFTAQNPAIPGGLYESFSGSLQEIRYYNSVISESVFKDYIMNPHSIEGNNLNSSPYNLAFRASLGGELNIGSVSIHPKITGSWTTTSSFNFNSNFSYTVTPTFNPNTEYFFIDQPLAGIRNAISDKIRIENNIIPSGDTLSAFRSLSQNVEISQSYTVNTNLLEVAFSPQDELNDDIANQIGYYNIGEYIGDPRFRSSSALTYPELDTLRNEYFEKYTKNYNLVDFIRLIKFFDNSLFKMIKDFVPARTSLASGIIIKQHILERNRYPQPQVDTYSTIAYTTSGSNNNIPFTSQDISVTGTLAPQWNGYQPGTVENFSGGPAGVFNPYNSVLTSPYGENGTGPNNIYFLTQSWSESIATISGSVVMLHSTQDEFYNGEFSGSVLTVTTQSLAQSYPLQNVSLPYQQVLYFPTLSGSIFPLNEIDEAIFFNNFINPITSPQNGEMMIFIDYETFSIPFPGGSEYAATYFKIAKIDSLGNDNSTVLGQLDKILIYNSSTSQYTEFDLDVLNEYSNYYLYKVNPTIYGNFPFVAADNKILDYTVSASITIPEIIPGATVYPFLLTASINPLNYYDSSSGNTNFGYTPNTPLNFTASFLAQTSIGTAALNLNFQQIIPGFIGLGTVTSQTFNITTIPTTYTISGSFYPVQGSSYYSWGFIPVGSPVTITNAEFLITQSRTPNSPSSVSNIVEPYITEPNYYNSDYNPLINNVLDDRLSTVYQDVDYSTGTTTPTNFSLLISGSALKAPVQDSNYTTKRHILPRYEGSKSTSQYLNVWTEGDSGTYGKTPTVESLKTMVAYCDSISGWPPERMNASAVHVLYLIKQDGTVIIPNTSENSLTEIQGTFMSGEKLLISSKTIGSGEAVQSRNIIRGGTRIEPILYTQYRQAPNALWNTTMSFTDIIPSNVGAVGNYLAEFKKTSNQTSIPVNTETLVTFNSSVYGNSFLNSNGYQVNAATIQDGVNLTFTTKLNIATTFNIAGIVIPISGMDIKVLLYNTTTNTLVNSQLLQNDSNFNVNYTFTVNNASLQSGLYKIYIQVYNSFNNGQNAGSYGNPTITIYSPPTFLKVSQYPAYTQPVTSSNANSIWNWPNSSSYPYVITSSQTTLVNLYGDPNVKMVDISGSGFNPVTLPWSIKYGDEFRFEGREDFAYQVGKIFGPSESGSGRIFPTGSIEVHLNSNLPTSASSTVFNLDHFAIRRYVDDASLILMEGFRPVNASGPYIVKPEYVVPELNKSVDQFILDLTQKGLIT